MLAELQHSSGCGEQRGLGDPLHCLHNCASPPTCCRCKKSSPEREALGCSRGGFSTKIYLRYEGTGKVITFLSAHARSGKRHRAGRKTHAGRCYSQTFRSCSITTSAPCGRQRLHQCRSTQLSSSLPYKQHYRKRNIVERLINRLKQFRRIATRYEKRASNFAAMITIASICLFSDFAYRL